MRGIDITSESPVTVTQAAKLFPNRPHVASVWRWILNGLNGINLESVKIGGRRYTSREAIQRFIERTTALADQKEVPVRCARQRTSAVDAAESELSKEGI